MMPSGESTSLSVSSPYSVISTFMRHTSMSLAAVTDAADHAGDERGAPDRQWSRAKPGPRRRATRPTWPLTGGRGTGSKTAALRSADSPARVSARSWAGPGATHRAGTAPGWSVGRQRPDVRDTPAAQADHAGARDRERAEDGAGADAGRVPVQPGGRLVDRLVGARNGLRRHGPCRRAGVDGRLGGRAVLRALHGRCAERGDGERGGHGGRDGAGGA